MDERKAERAMVGGPKEERVKAVRLMMDGPREEKLMVDGPTVERFLDLKGPKDRVAEEE